MLLGTYLAGLQDRPLPEALDQVLEWGLDAGELAAGGFSGDSHCPVHRLLTDAGDRRRLLDEFTSRDLQLTSLNANGNPLHPDGRVGPAHRRDLFAAIDLAGELGVPRVIAMPGMPAAPGDSTMNWVVAPLDSGMREMRDRQWEEHLVPLWREVATRAEGAGVRVCIEIHSHSLVFNPPSMAQLIEDVGSSAIGVNLDPSHLWWQGIDPLIAVRFLGDRVFSAHGKDTRLNLDAIALAGYLDDRWRIPGEGDPQYSQGGPFLLNLPPHTPPWEFVAPGRGHAMEWWASFFRELDHTGNDVPVNIELFDPDLSLDEGTRYSAGVLREARKRADRMEAVLA